MAARDLGPPAGHAGGRPVAWPVVLGGAALVTVLVVRTAWMCDDAYITLRTVDNLVNGFGLRWNVAERVQAFTHPLWLFVIAPFYAVTREAFFTVLTVQVAIAAGTVGILARGLARSGGDALLAVAALASSKAYVEFSTSGLENGLTHLLIVVFLIRWRAESGGRHRLFMLGLLTSALLLTRLDLAALVAPLLLASLWRAPRAGMVACAAGLVPLVVWEVWSLVYYGQLVPNTALAKLPVGVSITDLTGQGLRYLAATFHFDPFTPVLLAIAVAGLGWLGGRTGRIVAAGVVLHLVYVISAGGDFMAGRFLTPAFVLAVAAAAAVVDWRVSMRTRAATAGLVVAASLAWPGSPVRSGAGFGAELPEAAGFDRHGVTDERRFYYPSLGLLPVLSGRVRPDDHTWARAGRTFRAGGPAVREASNTGLVGYYAGPDVYIIDRNALSDPFLARLAPRPDWRVGHYTRDVPAEYVESRRQDRNLLQDPALRRLYDRVQLLTRGPMWSVERWRAIGGR